MSGTANEFVQFLVSEGADVNAKNDSGETPLHFAAERRNDIENVKFLVSQGADVNAKGGEEGKTPLHLVASRGYGSDRDRNVEVARFLISQGANVNARDNYGSTPLHDAVSWYQDVEFVKLLVSQGANVLAKDKDGKTPHDWAMERGDVAIIEILYSEQFSAMETEIQTHHEVRRVERPRRLFRLLPGIFRLR